MRIVVTGGSGQLGSEVVRRVRELGHVAVPASRRWGVNVTTGQGLGAALTGADAVVHCASSPWRPRATDTGGTEQLLAAVAAMPRPAHVVHVSIVGCDANPYPYYRAKTAAEELVMAAAVPATVVRATQFHTLVAALARASTLGRAHLALDAAAQPVDVGWVARELVDHALGSPPAGAVRALDLAGPEVLTVSEAVSAVRDHDGRPRTRAVRMPTLGRTLRAFAQRSNLPGPGAVVGGPSFTDWLAGQPAPAGR
ncbi:SDR family oxidoreductase [Ruania halotolerans]|uniref:SDR family oxidoreductase n=1 Tax=Ruania halotolerans TaxID=2897773 RepID=UPI001E3FFAFA|nr:NAD-dependent epimerase/dehydratase family protein [Ruania halotolerans]UFU06663.1 sugar nucleotide-binding protein [Ruania halotolerans]